MYYKRACENTIKEMMKSFPAIAVYGPRQCGKSTMLNMLFNDSIESVTLDDIDELNLAQSNPKLFLDSHPVPIIIDEIQKAPVLLEEIKRRIDLKKLEWLKKSEPYQLLYIISGSNQFELSQGISDSLAGRIGIVELNTFSLSEKLSLPCTLFQPEIDELRKKENIPVFTKKEIFNHIFQGGMPEIVTQKADRNIYFKSYLETYLEKDVSKLISVGNKTTFLNFISYLAYRTAQEINYNDISSSIGIDVKTVKRWLSILEASHLIVFLQPFMKNVSNRIIKAPKLYFMDTGLASYLCGWPNAQMLENCAMSKAFYETFVVSEIIKTFLYHNEDYRHNLFFYRDIDQKEIDIIYEKNQEIYPIEIKKGIRPTKPNKNFNVLEKFKLPIKTGLIIDSTDKIRPINEKVYTIPIGLIE